MIKTAIFVFFLLGSIICHEGHDSAVCATDTLQCPDGTFVDRDPHNNCEFAPCPDESTIETTIETGGTEEPLPIDTDTTVCATDTLQCPDGTFVDRDPHNNCEFAPCIEDNETAVDTQVSEETLDTIDTDIDTQVSEETLDTFGTDIDTMGTDIDTQVSEETLDTFGTAAATLGETQTETKEETKSKGDCHQTGEIVPGSPCATNTKPTETALSEYQLSSNCVYGTLLYNGYCACWSGAFGKKCEMSTQTTCTKIISDYWRIQSDTKANCYLNAELDVANNERDFCMNWNNHPSCNSWGAVQSLSTLNPPKMDYASFSGGNLNITVSQPIVNGRADGAAFLNDINLNSTQRYCIYPISDYIYKEVQGCRDVWRFSLPWNLASKCGWNIQDTDGYRIYKGQVIVHNHEYLDNINDCRFIQSVLRIKITFQLFVQVTLTSTVYNQPNLQSAITRQIVAVKLGEAACLQLTTTINYPYQLTNGALVSTPPGKVVSHTFSGSIEQCSGTTECRQRWNSCLDLANGTCDLNGPYRMNFTKACRSSGIQCPLTESDKLAVVDFTLVSENFCAEIAIDIGLYGSIKSYSDSTFTTQRSSFILGQRACYLVTVNSDSNPNPYNVKTAAIILSSTQLSFVTVRVNDAIVRLYSTTNSTTDLGTSFQVVQQSQGNLIGFCFTFSDTLITNLECYGVVTVYIGAEVYVNYQDGSTNSNQTKRYVLEDGTDKSSFSTDNSLDSKKSNPNGNGGSILLASFLLFLLSLIL